MYGLPKFTPSQNKQTKLNILLKKGKKNAHLMHTHISSVKS
jgi:hypothetical protein